MYADTTLKEYKYIQRGIQNKQMNKKNQLASLII